MSRDTPNASTPKREVTETAEASVIEPNGSHSLPKMLKYGGGGGAIAVIIIWLFAEGAIVTKDQRMAEYDKLRLQLLEEIRREQKPVMQKLDEMSSRLGRVEHKIESGFVTRDQFNVWLGQRFKENKDKGIDWGALPLSVRESSAHPMPY